MRDYWRLVYSSARHNTAVKYWALRDPPVSVPGVERRVHAVELAPPDPEELADIVDELQKESAAYLDENLAVIARPEIVAFEKDTVRRVTRRKRFFRGDADASGRVNVTDAFRTLSYVFRSGRPLDCEKAADANDDGKLNINDAIHLLRYLFFQGPELAPPNRLCDTDPTRDSLDCDSFEVCIGN